MKRTLILSVAFFAVLLAIGCDPRGASESTGGDTSRVDSVSSVPDIDTVNPDSGALMNPDGPSRGPASLRDGDTIRHVKILYGTDRKEVKSVEPYVTYQSVPEDIAEAYKVGYTIVTIPQSHVPGVVERPSIWKLQFSEDSTKHMINKQTVKLSDQAFDQMIHNTTLGSEAFLFVHGYNNTFEEAALRAGQITEDIGLPITPIMFSWSSDGATLSYSSDEDNITLATPAFKHFLKRITTQGRYQKLHIIAHSMGNRLVSAALNELEGDPINLKIDQIIMAAPDIYAIKFQRDLSNEIVKRSKKVTVYASSNDWALRTSNKFHKNLRLGQVSNPPFPVKNVDIIDASKVKTDFLGHGTFAQSQTVMTDINKLVTTGLNPKLRGIKYLKMGALDYYYFEKWKSK